jgi:SAM-dependent methyltransferase
MQGVERISVNSLDLHGERAALRGNPSFVWRAGQDRRLAMIVRWGIRHPRSVVERILVDGCGVGMYVRALQPYAAETWGIDIEPEHLALARENAPDAHLQLAMCEALPLSDDSFDMVLSHEVIEHVRSDRGAAAEMVRVLKPGGRAVIFAPNRWYPFETHGHYWRGEYHFGNTPFINYLPGAIRDRMAPHVRCYSAEALRSLFLGLPVRVIHHSQVMPGYDNVTYRRPALGKALRRFAYAMEHTAVRAFGISHLLVVEKAG